MRSFSPSREVRIEAGAYLDELFLEPAPLHQALR
jgi:hypothetical protein